MGRQNILDCLKQKDRIEYSELAFEILQVPLVSDKMVKSWLVGMRDEGLIFLDGLSRKAAPKTAHPSL
jgi:hypothetical protein